MAKIEKPRKKTTRPAGRTAAARKPARAAARLIEPAVERGVEVDYPQHGELVASHDYTFRVSTPMEGGVEVSVDGGPWLPCRSAEGYWWHDWSGYGAGSHEVRARVSSEDGFGSISEAREFVVELN